MYTKKEGVLEKDSLRIESKYIVLEVHGAGCEEELETILFLKGTLNTEKPTEVLFAIHDWYREKGYVTRLSPNDSLPAPVKKVMGWLLNRIMVK